MAEFAQADVETLADSNDGLQYRTESGETVDLLRPGFSPEPLLYDSAIVVAVCRESIGARQATFSQVMTIY